jgi:hypothetical protein
MTDEAPPVRIVSNGKNYNAHPRALKGRVKVLCLNWLDEEARRDNRSIAFELDERTRLWIFYVYVKYPLDKGGKRGEDVHEHGAAP